MAENVRKENVQNALKDLQKYLDDLYYSDEDLNEEEYEFLQNALENLATKEDANSTERERMAMSEAEYHCREMGGEWVPAHSRKGTYVRGFCRKKKR